ncbi:MAG: phosphatidylserine decarboxylase [Undibacterium sp.]|nr:phosphatidylserine decarboxylase [Undibacterium sp.]
MVFRANRFATICFVSFLLALNATTVSAASYSSDNPKRALAPAAVKLRTLYQTDAAFKQKLDEVFVTLSPEVEGKPNPWLGKNVQDLLNFVDDWHYFLPVTTNGLTYIRQFQALYADNPAGLRFIRDETAYSWIKGLVEERGHYMDSKESIAKVGQWKADPRIGMQDYIEPKAGYQSFNEFFTRSLKPGRRPVASPQDDSVIVSPADCIVQIMDVNLTDSTQLPTKGTEHLNLSAMLANSPLAKHFVGGTAIRCILEPTSYHHYHAPVSGLVLEANENVAGPYFEERIVPSAARHHRGYLIIDTAQYGKVAMVAIGLATISKVQFEKPFARVIAGKTVAIKKGERVGHFAYGGSMVYLLLEKNRLESLGVRQGQQLGVFERNEK